MKTTKKDYVLFKNECNKLLKKFVINDVDLYFEWKDLKKNDAQCYRDSDNSTYIISLSKDVDIADPFTKNGYIKNLAKHEIIHILLARIISLAKFRYLRVDELDYEEEKLIRKLEKLL